MNDNIKEILDELSEYADTPVVPGEVPLRKDEDIGFDKKTIAIDWIADTYEKILAELSIDRTMSYLTYNGKRVYGVRMGKSVDLSNVTLYNRNELFVTNRKPDKDSIDGAKFYETNTVEVLVDGVWIIVPTSFNNFRRIIIQENKLDI